MEEKCENVPFIYHEPIKFEQKWTGTKLTVSEQGKKITQIGRDDFETWRSCLMMPSVAKFSVKIDGKEVYIGFAPKTLDLEDSIDEGSNNEITYSLYSADGAISGPGKDIEDYLPELDPNSIVTCYYDKTAGTISFGMGTEKDAKPPKVAFSNVPQEPELFPAISCGNEGTILTIVD